MAKGRIVGLRNGEPPPDVKVFDLKGKLLRVEKPPEIDWAKLNQQKGLRK